MSSLNTRKEPILIYYFEVSYVPRGGKILSVSIKLIYVKRELVILGEISAYECYIYAFTVEVIGDYPRFYIWNHLLGIMTT